MKYNGFSEKADYEAIKHAVAGVLPAGESDVYLEEGTLKVVCVIYGAERQILYDFGAMFDEAMELAMDVYSGYFNGYAEGVPALGGWIIRADEKGSIHAVCGDDTAYLGEVDEGEDSICWSILSFMVKGRVAGSFSE